MLTHDNLSPQAYNLFTKKTYRLLTYMKVTFSFMDKKF